MVLNRSAPPGAIVPTLVYDDVGSAVAWLYEAYGFTEHLRWGPAGGETLQLRVGAGAVFVRGPQVGHGTAERLSWRPPRPDELSQALMVEVDDVDRHYERATKNGAEILLPPETYRFGEQQYSARDQAGYVWTFTQSVADVAPEDWGAQIASAE